ncbi:hypothetical protein NDU88_005751 [Pleurodeles waltl]|uniref:MAP3K deoxyribohydrolase domain-containing protein n=1 Tax=Pleurodeles waltl TaxID=8319 RepID=A0AAV7NW59_PLEWA|nr:hypothetical protein NDU88_005751 [Pleurodeles waltl]
MESSATLLTAVEPGGSGQQCGGGCPETAAACGGLSPSEEGGASHCGPTPPRQRSLRVVYVLNDSPKTGPAGSTESGALQCLLRACEAEGGHLSSVNFGELDFGETAVLDTFYDAGEKGGHRELVHEHQSRPNLTLYSGSTVTSHK